MSSLMGSPGLMAAAREEPARSLPAGVHLFLDSELIAGERNLRRVIRPPARLPEPIVTAAQDRCSDVSSELRVGVCDERGRPIDGFDAPDSTPLRGDSLRHPVRWNRPLAALRRRPIRLGFTARDAR